MSRNLLRLSLLRHAKSSWDDPDLTDHERQLTKRGTKSAVRIGQYLSMNGLIPDLILCSDAIRTRATLALILPALPKRPQPATVITEKLYLASPTAILESIAAGAGNKTRHVMVIGHNPGLHALALSLPANGTVADLTALAQKFPTAALAHIEFQQKSWVNLEPASGTLTHFITPRTFPA